MTSSFASLIVITVLALVRSTAVPLPAPLQQLSHALAGVNGYRTVMTVTTTVGAHTTSTIQSDTIFLRKGNTQTSYAVITVKTQGQTLHSENVSTGTRACERVNSKSAWSCQAIKVASTPASAAEIKKTFGRLSSDFQWSSAGTSTIAGQAAVGYRAVSASKSGQRVSATLWIATKSKLPLELRSTTTTISKSGTTTQMEVVDWSRWNDSSLSVPAI
jgi:hypothetical protein